MNEQERLEEQLLKGRCCSQAIMTLALEDMDIENDNLVVAMTPFCGGMGRGKVCGSLAAAVAALHLRDTQRATETWQREFMEWFEVEYGALDCSDIINDDPSLRAQVCPSLILGTYLKLREYLI